MNPKLKRILAPTLVVLLTIGVGVALYLSISQGIKEKQTVTLTGLIGSEKEEFFNDPRVIEVLRKNGLIVKVRKAGSRSIAARTDLADFDFVFPSGVPAATKLRMDNPTSKSYDAFYTPMAIATWQPIVDILVANDLARDEGGYYSFDMEKYIQLVQEDKRWSDLTNNGAYNVNKNMLITSTDVRSSNSAGMYLALATYFANNRSVLQSDRDVQKVLPFVSPLFLKQGFTEYSSEVPFQDYLSMGIGKAPMVFIYEAQFIQQAAQANGIRSDMVLMYPNMTIYSKHTVVALTPEAQKLGELLVNDPVLKRLEIEHGFRNSDLDYFKQIKTDRKLEKLPDVLVNVVEPPSYELLEQTIQAIEAMYKQ